MTCLRYAAFFGFAFHRHLAQTQNPSRQRSQTARRARQWPIRISM